MGGLPTSRTMNGFVVNPENPKIMFVAMRDGLLKSTDAGASWKRVGTEIKNLVAVAIRSKLTMYQNMAMRIYPKASPPNVLIGGPVPVSPGFPPKDGSVRSHVADPIEALGNDGL